MSLRAVLACVVVCWPAHAALAQLALPGATAPSEIGSVVKPSAPHRARGAAPSLAPAPPAATNEAGLAGKTLSLNGGRSEIAFTARDKTVDVSRLLFEGVKISNGRDVCQIDVQGMPLALSPTASAEGLHRFSVPVPACPVTFQALDGAVLMSVEGGKCSFKEADCEVSPNGLWGPTAGAIGPDQVKMIERERMRAERDLRSAYKGLVTTVKDRALVSTFARDQAGFSSHREEVCRDYVGEARHGFCASRLTASRASELETAYAAAAAAKAKSKKK